MLLCVIDKKSSKEKKSNLNKMLSSIPNKKLGNSEDREFSKLFN